MAATSADAPAGEPPTRAITVRPDRFQGRICKVVGVPDPASREDGAWFADEMDKLLEGLRESTPAVRGVWVEVPTSFLAAVGDLRARDFRVHHADDASITLNTWLPDERKDPNLMPPFAHTFCGVGSVVVRGRGGTGRASDDPDSAEVLVVAERWAMDSTTRYKFPGGFVDKGERLPAAAVREVREETSIRARFRRVVAFKHSATFAFGCSDFYFACLCEPEDPKQEPVRDPLEIAETRWLPIRDMLADDRVYGMNKELLRAALAALRDERVGVSVHPRELSLPGAPRPYRYDVFSQLDEDGSTAAASPHAESTTDGGRGLVAGFALGALVAGAAALALGVAGRRT